MRKELEERMKDTDNLIKEALTFLSIAGVDYDLNEWMTLKSYCEKFDIENTQTVPNWISRGIVPPENVKEIKELNDLKIIRAVRYR